MTREQLPEFKRIGVVGQPRAGRTLPQNRKNTGRENIADVLEEIWRTTDREFSWLTSADGPAYSRMPSCAGPHSGRRIRGLLCCRTAIGAETAESGALGCFVHPMPASS